MTRAYGTNAKLRVKTESVYGTSPGGNFVEVPFVSCDFNEEQKLIADDSIGHGREEIDPGRDMIDVVHDFEVPVDLNNIGIWLRGLLGPAVDTGSTPHYIHTFTSGAATLPSISRELGFTDIARFSMGSGIVVDELTFPFITSGMVNAKGKLIGQTDARSGSSGAGTPTTNPFTRFSSFEGSIALGGSPLAGVSSAELTFANKSEAVKVIRSDGLVDGVDPTLAQVTGKLNVRFQDDTLLGDAAAGTPVSLTLAYTIDSNNSLTFTLPRVFLPQTKNPVKGPGGIHVSFDFRAVHDSGSGYALQAVLKNGIATYA